MRVFPSASLSGTESGFHPMRLPPVDCGGERGIGVAISEIEGE